MQTLHARVVSVLLRSVVTRSGIFNDMGLYNEVEVVKLTGGILRMFEVKMQ